MQPQPATASHAARASHSQPARAGGGGVTTTQTRLLGCYLDYAVLQVVDPSGLTVTESLFLETHANFTASKSRALSR
jgi:hypothetical protein